MNTIPASFTPGQSATDTNGQVAHPLQIEQSQRLAERLYKVGRHAWTYVGNGLSNQTFIEGPEGLIAIDTGECEEEMATALKALRRETDKPIVACMYSHFHYVSGTTAILEEGGITDLPIYGHAGIQANLDRFGGEVAPRSSRGLVHQFAVMMPTEGPDGLVNVGLGRFFRNPDHAPFTPGYIPANQTFSQTSEFTIAGLKVICLPAPSDATDSITIWFPELKLAVNNLLWPALFNVFAIRGEEYRDPRILLTGLDEMAALGADYLLGTHGPPLEGGEVILETLTLYRDSIQYLWDQTVRGANLGLTLDELTTFVQLPDHYSDSFYTSQLYGVVEHHVRQIYMGLFGWFDEDEARIFPTPAPNRAQKLIAGFGGKSSVRMQIDQALANDDFRWALELSSWLVRSEKNEIGQTDGGEQQDRDRLAAALRGVAYSTTSANVRNWCLTRALELDGSLDLSRFRIHRFRVAEVESQSLLQSLKVLRVLLNPKNLTDQKYAIQINLDSGESAVLVLRNGVAVPKESGSADVAITLTKKHWAQLLGGKTSFRALVEQGDIQSANVELARTLLENFDVQGFAS